MNGYFARAGLCSGTTSVDFGSYSSIDIVCAEAKAAEAAARTVAPEEPEAVSAHGEPASPRSLRSGAHG